MSPASLLIRRGEVVIDLARYRVAVGGVPVVPTYREYALLVYLATRPGQVVSRRRLLEEALGRHDVGGLRLVDVCIRQLKSTLERHGPVCIEETADGYRFLPQDEPLA